MAVKLPFILKIKQFLCSHKKQAWSKKEKGEVQNIRGERHFLICEDCGKVMDDCFIENY